MGMPAAPAIAADLKSRHTADAHKIGHDEVAGLLLQREVNVARAVEIFAYLDRRLQFGGEPGAAVEIVVEHRFLDPDKAKIVNHVARRKESARLRAWLKSTIRSISSPIASRTAFMVARSSRASARPSRSFTARNPPPLSSGSLPASAAADSGDCSHSPLLL